MFHRLEVWVRIFLCCLLVGLSCPSSVSADPIYSKQDSSGRSIYTTKPDTLHAKPIELPKIKREEAKTAKEQPQSCKTRGGIDCGAGADTDGSVICIDGFRDAIARFNFSCTSSRLEIVEISQRDSSGKIKIYIRNVTSVPANDVSVSVRDELGQKATLSGSRYIPGYESGEYVYNPSNKFQNSYPIDRGKITVNCSNCL